MSFYKLDNDAVAGLVKYYNEGHSILECSDHFQSSYSLVATLLRENTTVRKKNCGSHSRISPEDQKQILKRYKNGDLLREIAVDYGTHPCWVSALARKHNLPKRGQGRNQGEGVVCRMEKGEYAAHIEAKYPGITALLGKTSITMESIGQRYGITRERVRQFERRLGTVKRLPLRIEAGKINAKRRELARQERWKARGTRWKQIGGEIALLIESGCSREELVKALPWRMDVGKTPLNQRISQRLYHLRKISGVDIPKPKFFFQGGRPIQTKR